MALLVHPPRAFGVAVGNVERLQEGQTAVAIGGGFPRQKEPLFTGESLEKDFGPPAACISAALMQRIRGEFVVMSAPAAAPDIANTTTGKVFFVKDASPDSVLAGFLVMARDAQVDLDGIEPWLQSVVSWDAGDMAPEPAKNWPTLASCLAHLEFPVSLTQQPPPVGDWTGQAWLKVLRFLVESIRDEHKPTDMPPMLSGEGAQAHSALRRLEQLYQDCLRHGTVMQLSVPLRGTAGKHLQVDALVYTEHEASDAMKILGRVDRTNPPAKRGFGLGISHRPGAEDWNRFTIHADPSLGIDLTDLWQALERRETEEWTTDGAIARPAGPATGAGPANGAASYTPDQIERLSKEVLLGVARPLAGVGNVWVNPWFLAPDRSLIGSPGKDSHGVAAGASKLNWNHVIDAVWACYMPAARAMVVPVGYPHGTRHLGHVAQTTPLQKSRLWESPTIDKELGAASKSSRKLQLRFIDWPRDSNSQDGSNAAIDFNQTIVRMLGTLAGQRNPGPNQVLDPTEYLKFDKLVAPDSARKISIKGGLAVVSEDGCIVIDDWRDQDVDTDAICHAMRLAQSVASDADKCLEDYRELSKRLEDLRVVELSPLKREPYDLLRDIASKRRKLAATSISRLGLQIKNSDAANLYRELLEHWRAREILAQADQGLAQLETSFRGEMEARSAYVVKLIGLVGFPMAVAPAIAKPLAAGINGTFLYFGYKLPLPEASVDDFKTFGEGLLWVVTSCLLYLIIRYRLSPGRTDAASPPKGANSSKL